jgi:hypothetical protein
MSINILRHLPTCDGAQGACHDYAGRLARGLYTPGVMVSFSGGGGGGGALTSPAGILVLLVLIAVVAGVYWLFNR